MSFLPLLVQNTNVAVHTTGVNWISILAITGTVVALASVVAGVLSKPYRDKLDSLSEEQKEIKSDAKAAALNANDTSRAVARIEGFLAALNGKGSKLPELSEQKE